MDVACFNDLNSQLLYYTNYFLFACITPYIVHHWKTRGDPDVIFLNKRKRKKKVGISGYFANWTSELGYFTTHHDTSSNSMKRYNSIDPMIPNKVERLCCDRNKVGNVV